MRQPEARRPRRLRRCARWPGPPGGSDPRPAAGCLGQESVAQGACL